MPTTQEQYDEANKGINEIARVFANGIGVDYGDRARFAIALGLQAVASAVILAAGDIETEVGGALRKIADSLPS